MSNTDLSTTINTATVDVKSAWASRINWTQVVGIGASALVIVTGGKVNIPLAEQGEIVLAIQSVCGLATWALKTYAKPTVTPTQARLHA